LVIEVKDWKLDSIKSITRASVSLLTKTGVTQVAHPLEQARQYAFQITGILQRDPALRAPQGHPHEGKLICPYGYGLVLSAITRKQFDGTDLRDVIPPHLVICKDEMTASADAEEFQKRLWDMFTVRFNSALTLPQVDRIRWHMFPEIRITQGGLFSTEDPELNCPPTMRVMDLKQEQLARSLGDGHRVIHGVSGSGKTLILGYRCERLAHTTHKPILVLTFNVSLAAKLEHMMSSRDLLERVNILHFHGWCTRQLELYHVQKPQWTPEGYPQKLVESVIQAVDRGQIPRGQYGAVLIDEGHDFEPGWLKLVAQMVDPDTNSLLLLYDDAQSIYGRRTKEKFSFLSVGIHARGRTTILKVNYRNTAETLRCAYDFAKDVIKPADADDDGVPLVKPETAGRHGPPPKLIRANSLEGEAQCIAQQIKGFRAGGTPLKEIAVLYPAKFIAEEVMLSLKAADIPYEWLQKDQAARRYNVTHESVKVMTMHSSKGLEFPVVILAGVGHMADRQEKQSDDARLLYVAMTRATEKLIITASRSSSFVERLQELERAA
jgi:superfamily I DNA/RNA helicase